MRVKNVTYNFDPCLVRWRYVRAVCSNFTVFQNLHVDTPEIVNYIFDPPPRGKVVVVLTPCFGAKSWSVRIKTEVMSGF